MIIIIIITQCRTLHVCREGRTRPWGYIKIFADRAAARVQLWRDNVPRLPKWQPQKSNGACSERYRDDVFWSQQSFSNRINRSRRSESILEKNRSYTRFWEDFGHNVSVYIDCVPTYTVVTVVICIYTECPAVLVSSAVIINNCTHEKNSSSSDPRVIITK